MLRTSLFLIAIVCLTASSATQSTAEDILPAGTLLQCTLDEPNFSSHTAEIGDPVLCSIGALAEFGHNVFPRGAYISGRFQEYRDPGRLFGKGWMELGFDRLVLPGAVTVPLSAKVISTPHYRVNRDGKVQGRGHAKRDAVEWAVPVLWPVKVLTLPARGPRPTLKGEVRITLRLLEDVEIPTATIASSTTRVMPRPTRLRPSREGTDLQQELDASPKAALPLMPEPAQQSRNTEISSFFSAAMSVPQLTWLILKDGTSYLVKDYWVELGKMQFVTLDGERKLLPLTRLDLDQTLRINQERNVAFVIRSRENTEP